MYDDHGKIELKIPVKRPFLKICNVDLPGKGALPIMFIGSISTLAIHDFTNDKVKNYALVFAQLHVVVAASEDHDDENCLFAIFQL